MASPNTDPSKSAYQDKLTEYCRNSQWRAPTYQVVSDRRGGRTAWSAVVMVQGQQHQARFWYDGQYVNNAKEDAAQVALFKFGQLPQNGPGQTPQPQQAPQQSQSPPQQQAAQQQPPNYGVIGS